MSKSLIIVLVLCLAWFVLGIYCGRAGAAPKVFGINDPGFASNWPSMAARFKATGSSQAGVTIQWCRGFEDFRLGVPASQPVLVILQGRPECFPRTAEGRMIYADYARHLVERNPNIRELQVWNEPEYRFNAEQYVPLLAATWDAIHQNEPQVFSTGLASANWPRAGIEKASAPLGGQLETTLMRSKDPANRALVLPLLAATYDAIKGGKDANRATGGMARALPRDGGAWFGLGRVQERTRRLQASPRILILGPGAHPDEVVPPYRADLHMSVEDFAREVRKLYRPCKFSEETSYGTGLAHLKVGTRRLANHVGGDGAAVSSESSSGQLSGKDGERQVQGLRLDSSSPEATCGRKSPVLDGYSYHPYWNWKPKITRSIARTLDRIWKGTPQTRPCILRQHLRVNGKGGSGVNRDHDSGASPVKPVPFARGCLRFWWSETGAFSSGPQWGRPAMMLGLEGQAQRVYAVAHEAKCNPLVAGDFNYLLTDEQPTHAWTWQSGLYTVAGQPKPALYAFRAAQGSRCGLAKARKR